MAKFEEIEKQLNKENIAFKVIDLPATAVSVDDVIRLTNGQVKEEEIVKTVLVKRKEGEFVSCVLKGRDRVNMKENGFYRLATKEEVLEIAGVEPGAVCPILIGVPIVIDKKVMHHKRVNMGSGDHLKGLEMDLESLLKVLSDYTVEEISL